MFGLLGILVPGSPSSRNVDASLAEVTFLGHKFCPLRAFHPLPRLVQGGPHFLD